MVNLFERWDDSNTIATRRITGIEEQEVHHVLTFSIISETLNFYGDSGTQSLFLILCYYKLRCKIRNAAVQRVDWDARARMESLCP